MFPAQLLRAKALRQGWTCRSPGRSGRAAEESQDAALLVEEVLPQPYRGGGFQFIILGGPGAPGQWGQVCGLGVPGCWQGCHWVLLGRRLYKPPDTGGGALRSPSCWHPSPTPCSLCPPPHLLPDPSGWGQSPLPSSHSRSCHENLDSLGGQKTELRQFLGISATRFPSEDTGCCRGPGTMCQHCIGIQALGAHSQSSWLHTPGRSPHCFPSFDAFPSGLPARPGAQPPAPPDSGQTPPKRGWGPVVQGRHLRACPGTEVVPPSSQTVCIVKE